MSVAKPLPHDSAALHVTGRARYVDDIPAPPGTLSLAFGLSSVARGRITTLGLDAVRAAPGVVVVITAGDLPFANDTSPSAHDEPLLSTGAVHYVGQPLFLVAAESHLLARKAVRHAKVEIEAAEPILSIAAALAAASRFEEGPRVYVKGDAATAIAASPLMVEGEIEIGGQEHFYLEGQAALALPGEDDGEMHILTSTPAPDRDPAQGRRHARRADGTRCRSEVRRMGGGFGGKESQGNALAIACAVAGAARPAAPCADALRPRRRFRGHGQAPRLPRSPTRCGHDRLWAGCVAVRVPCTGRALRLERRICRLPVADRAMLHADNAYLTFRRCADRELAAADQHAVRHRLPRLRRAAGDARDRAGDGSCRACVLGRDPLEVRRRELLCGCGIRMGRPQPPRRHPPPSNVVVLGLDPRHLVPREILGSSRRRMTRVVGRNEGERVRPGRRRMHRTEGSRGRAEDGRAGRDVDAHPTGRTGRTHYGQDVTDFMPEQP